MRFVLLVAVINLNLDFSLKSFLILVISYIALMICTGGVLVKK